MLLIRSVRPLGTRSRAVLVALLGTFVLVAAMLALPRSAIQPAGAAISCPSTTWSASAVYVAGDKVTLGGHAWRAKWWTQNERPGTTGEWGVWVDEGACGGPTTPPTTTPPTTPPPTTPPPTTPPPTTQPPVTGQKTVGYFTEWGVYDRNYDVKNIDTSGSASRLTHVVYAFGNVQNGQCTVGDSYAAYDKFHSAAESVDGVADSWDAGALRGNFNQLRKLKAKYPNLKVVWSFGGWTWSNGFTQAAQNPTAFADSCYRLVNDPRWAGVFDGIDIDWEYPNACGLACDTSGRAAYPGMIRALRQRFGNQLVTSAITADGTSGGKIEAGGYETAAQYLDFFMVMSYDYFGAFAPQGPTAPHSPLTDYTGIPRAGYNGEQAINRLTQLGVPASKLLLGVGFYGRGWTGVTQATPGGSATGAAPGKYEAGIEDYKVLAQRCPSTGTVAGTAYAKCGSEWWSYDTPATLRSKAAWSRQRGLGGTFFWELGGDTADGALIRGLTS